MALQILQNLIDDALEKTENGNNNSNPSLLNFESLRQSLIRTAENLYVTAENQMQDAKRKGKVWLEGYFATEKKEIGQFIEHLKRSELGEFQHGNYQNEN